jgi:hypothetical protein
MTETVTHNPAWRVLGILNCNMEKGHGRQKSRRSRRVKKNHNKLT